MSDVSISTRPRAYSDGTHPPAVRKTAGHTFEVSLPVVRAIEQLPPWMSFADAEAIASRLNDLDLLTIGLNKFRRTRLFGEGALLGLVQLAKARGKEVHVQLSNELTPFNSGGGGKYWKIFTESVTGFILGQSAHRICDGADRDVTDEVRGRQSLVLKGTEGFIGSGREVAAAISDRFGAPRSADLVRESSATHVRHLLAYSLAARLGIHGEPGGALSDVTSFVSEVLENTRDHAMADLDGAPIEGIRFLNVRRINRDQEDLAEPEPSGFGSDSFTPALTALLASPAEHLVEITVADSGPGIAARMAGTAAVYDAPIADERKLVCQAFERGGSSKPSSVTGRGLGLGKVREATERLGGLFVIRTGRTRVYLGGRHARDDGAIQGAHDSELPFLPGTSVSILIPWKVSDGQMNLFGNRDASCSR